METLGYVYLLLFVGLIIALCLFINRLTDKLNVPSLLLFIAIGMLAGVLLRPVFGNVTDYADFLPQRGKVREHARVQLSLFPLSRPRIDDDVVHRKLFPSCGRAE